MSEVASASPDVREYIGTESRRLLDSPDFTESLAGFLLPDAGSQARRGFLMERLRRLAPPRGTEHF